MNGKFESEIQIVVSTFVEQVTDIAKRTTMETLARALSSSNGKHSVAMGSVSRTGQKRDPAVIKKTAETFRAHVAKHPGLRIEQINKQLGTKTKDLALPIRNLIAEGAIKTKGEKRSTTYFAARA
jgi:hypothetical protein